MQFFLHLLTPLHFSPPSLSKPHQSKNYPTPHPDEENEGSFCGFHGRKIDHLWGFFWSIHLPLCLTAGFVQLPPLFWQLFWPMPKWWRWSDAFFFGHNANSVWAWEGCCASFCFFCFCILQQKLCFGSCWDDLFFVKQTNGFLGTMHYLTIIRPIRPTRCRCVQGKFKFWV